MNTNIEYPDIKIEHVKITYSINWIYLRRTFRNMWKWYCEKWEIYSKKIEENSKKISFREKVNKLWEWYCEKWNKIFNEKEI